MMVKTMLLVVSFLAAGASPPAAAPRNLLENGGFEQGQAGWRLDKAGATAASFRVDDAAAAEGKCSGLISVEKAEEWGVQFGQNVPAGAKGKTYTFAVMARAVGGPATVRLEIERPAKPWDRAARSELVALPADKWIELHVTFKVDKDFPEGWFAYVSCDKAGSKFRLDGFRLYEGEYGPPKPAASAAAAEELGGGAVRLLDTGSRADAALPAEAVAKAAGWAEVPPGKLDHAFKGDVVVRNEKLAVVLRQKAGALELHALGGQAAPLRARLVPLGAAGGAAALSAVRILANAPHGVTLEAAFAAGAGKAIVVAFTLRPGQPMVETKPAAGAMALRVEAPCRLAVMPDFFADDMVLDAATMPAAATEVPADHFLLHLLPDRQAIVMTVRTTADDDVKLALSGEGDGRRIDAAELPFGKDGAIWAAVLTGEPIWHTRDIAASDAEKMIDLGWTAPFPALWRVDWRTSEGLSDSWEMITERPDGSFSKYAWFGQAGSIPPDRKRWATVLGSFRYPCWLDRRGRGFLQPLKRGVRFEGPAVLYPINRERQTPMDLYTVVDVVRAALGVGPCEYVLDMEGQRSQNRGRATCANRDTLNPIYKAGTQRADRAKIEKSLEEVMIFIRFIRSRIEMYIASAHEVRDYLAARKKEHPELAKPLDELEVLVGRMDKYFASRRKTIQTPDDAQKLVDEFRATMLDYQGADAFEKCRKFTEAWVEIGGNQDELVGECRMVTRMLRQRSALLAAAEPRLADVAREIRARCQKALRNPAGHEGANH